MSVFGYLRVSTNDQNTENQRLAILEYANKNGFTVEPWIESQSSSRKSTKERNIDTLLERIHSGDTLIVSELSRLGLSVGQIIILIEMKIWIKRFMPFSPK